MIYEDKKYEGWNFSKFEIKFKRYSFISFRIFLIRNISTIDEYEREWYKKRFLQKYCRRITEKNLKMIMRN